MTYRTRCATAASFHHLKRIFAEGALAESATCKDYLQVRLEGGREASRNLRHYNLPAILAVGHRVRSPRCTQFRQWATAGVAVQFTRSAIPQSRVRFARAA